MSSSMTAFSVGSESYSGNVSSPWPFFTQPDFATFASLYVNDTGATLLSWTPLVEGDTNRADWGTYSTVMYPEWATKDTATIPPVIFPFNKGDKGLWAPIWQTATTGTSVDVSIINFDLMSSLSVLAKSIEEVALNTDAMSKQVLSPSLSPHQLEELFGTSLDGSAGAKDGIPSTILVTPIYADFASTPRVTGTILAVLPWTTFFQGILHPSQPKAHVVVSDSGGKLCGKNFTSDESSSFTIEIDGEDATYIGSGAFYESKYAAHGISASFGELFTTGDYSCQYTVTIYPSSEAYEATSNSNAAWAWTVAVVAAILLVAGVFLAYDSIVLTKQQKTIDSNAKTTAIVSSLFPADVRDRLLGKQKQSKNNKSSTIGMSNGTIETSKFRLKSYLAEEDVCDEPLTTPEGAKMNHLDDAKVKEALLGADVYDTKPIAELFPNTTVLFADIAGFTAWSSVREPTQVFTLLETVYRAFDTIAKRRHVFKVETVGDCYVAVTGLPEPRKDHAISMAKFARECLDKFNELSKQLEISLGPDTGDLALRTGLHSGPVTAGVLRGDKSRFQLFGATVNTAARVEATGMRNLVHISSDTAQLLMEGGKEHWVKKRADIVTAKVRTWTS
jgi:class 3 adenylate cyclase